MDLKNSTPFTPLELVSIFYDEALKIAANDDEAMQLTNKAVNNFMSHYKAVKLKTASSAVVGEGKKLGRAAQLVAGR
ncbi:hypothetical protein MNBD_NITROSPINAE01-1347 [hydrothermal vent metagenome]|uniref:Uncharacterized protein n=1 Tax=hydrothermal vent metagenome TaxID=652676 RepID=A0A3B1CGT7_9ZZZZ